MGRYALLIGVGEYGEGLQPLPAAPNDVAALAKVLMNPQIGGFNEVKPVVNPTHAEMAKEIELWFQGRESDDLIVLFFSGHGVKDDRRDLYFAARNTEKQRDRLVRSTATSARFVHECIRGCKAKYQVVILDCCFSGAFGEMVARDSGEINLKDQLGAEGRVVLTSTSAVDYSFEEKGSDLSIYTRYLVEGIASGAADEDEDGVITVDELHRYAGSKVEQTSPAMSPKIITLQDEGYRIRLARSPQDDPRLKYRKEVERRATTGQFSIPARRLLTSLRREFGISDAEAEAIEVEVLKPYQEYQRKRKEYQDTLRQCLQAEPILSLRTIRDLVDFREHLRLKPDDVVSIEREALKGYDLEGYAAEIERRRKETETNQRQQAEAERQRQAEAELRRQQQEQTTAEKRRREAQARQRQRKEAVRKQAQYTTYQTPSSNRMPSGSTAQQPSQKITAQPESSSPAISRKQFLLAGFSLIGLLVASLGQVFRNINGVNDNQAGPSKADDNQALEANVDGNQASQVDYTQLEEWLKAGQWREADQETANLMLRVVNREQQGWLDSDSINNFPCAVLSEIDRLWVEYSDGKFGFSVQSQIYFEDCGGDPSGAYDEEAYKCFGDRVGWRVNNQWLTYDEVIFDTTSLGGYLPMGGLLGFARWWWGSSILGALLSRCDM